MIESENFTNRVAAREARRVEKYQALLPEPLAKAMAGVQRQLENPRTGLLRLSNTTPADLQFRFGALVSLARENVRCIDSKRLPTKVRDGVELGRVLRDRFGASLDHLAAVLVDAEDWEEALSLAVSAAEDMDPEAANAAGALDAALVDAGLLQGVPPEGSPPHSGPLGAPPSLEATPRRALLARICAQVLDPDKCAVLATGEFVWAEIPPPSDELLADRMARLWLKAAGVTDPVSYLRERGYEAPEGQLPL